MTDQLRQGTAERVRVDAAMRVKALVLVRKQQQALTIGSPLKGTIITWDAERELLGRPVKRGDTLITVADTSGPWQLLLDVPEANAGHMLSASQREHCPSACGCESTTVISSSASGRPAARQ